ncbi:MAG: hypothetical protein KGL39_33585, partial [Patescibacteria group bacterium]|nr:hypothetical protein [Patescibacteria group bacterium]
MGTGANDGQCKNMLKTEAGLLAWEISIQLGPKTLPEGKKSIEKDVASVFLPLTAHEPFEGDRQGHSSDFTWLFAYGGGKTNFSQAPSFLVGAKTEDVRLYADNKEMENLFFTRSRKRGSVWHDLGSFSHSAPDKSGRMRPHFKRWRGMQHAIQINRVVVSKSAYQTLVRNVEARLGQLRASFAATSEALGLRKRIPTWVQKQIAKVKENGKHIFNDAGLNHPTEPFIEFGSRAKGV